MDRTVISGLVADKALGLGIVWEHGRPFMRDNRRSIPPFASDRSLVWHITDAMSKRGYIWTIGSGEHMDAAVAAIFHKPRDPAWSNIMRWTTGDDEAMTVCLAALRALEIEVPHE